MGNEKLGLGKMWHFFKDSLSEICEVPEFWFNKANIRKKYFIEGFSQHFSLNSVCYSQLAISHACILCTAFFLELYGNHNSISFLKIKMPA